MPPFKNINNRTFADGIKYENAILIDVRTPLEHEKGVIPGALLLDVQNPEAFVAGISDLDQDKAAYLYCRSGVRSAAACAHMAQMGFKELYNLEGGILGWDGEVAKP